LKRSFKVHYIGHIITISSPASRQRNIPNQQEEKRILFFFCVACGGFCGVVEPSHRVPSCVVGSRKKKA